MEQGESQQPLYRYRFGGAEFDEARGELRVDDAIVDLEQRPLQVLACLLHHADEVVTRQALFETVWAGRPTVDNVLTNAIAKLRKALGKETGALICTQPRVGYRLQGSVERSVSGTRISSRLDLSPGQAVPQREHFVLDKQIGPAHGCEVWLAKHNKTRQPRVYKFSTDGEHLAALKREATLYRVLHDNLGVREDFVCVSDWNFASPPFWLECEYGGLSLAEWATQESGLDALSLQQRLTVFLKIADAVAAAHSVGVLHKDLKPANVLITQHGKRWQIRVGDFGSGRLLDPQRLEAMRITAMGMTVTGAISDDSSGTPLYLAPELLVGDAPTVKSDLYALGLILYQLVIGNLRQPMAPGWQQNVDDELLREDIAASTDGNPARRLDSVEALCERLRSREARRVERAQRREAEQRTLLAEQALARTRARRPWVVAALLLLLAGLGIGTWQYARARHALTEAKHQAAIADASYRFVNEDLLGAGIGGNSPSWYQKNPRLREVLDAAAKRLDQRFSNSPLLQAKLHQTLGRAYGSTGAYAKSTPQLRSAVTLLQQALGATDERSILAQYELAIDLSHLSHYKQATRILDQADAAAGDRLQMVSEIALRAHRARGHVLYQQMRVAPALAQYTSAEHLQTLLRPDDAVLSAHLLLSISGCQLRLGHLAKAERIARRILAGAPYTADRVGLAALGSARLQLARVLQAQNRYREAIPIAQQSVQDFTQSTSADGQNTIGALSTLGYLYSLSDDEAQSLKIQRDVYQRSLQRWGPQNQFTLVELINLGSDEVDMGDLNGGLKHLQQAEAGLISLNGESNPTVHATRLIEANALSELGRNTEALALIKKVDPEAYQMSTSDPGRKGIVKAVKAQILLRLGKTKRGESIMREALTEMTNDGVSQEEIEPFRKQLTDQVASN